MTTTNELTGKAIATLIARDEEERDEMIPHLVPYIEDIYEAVDFSEEQGMTLITQAMKDDRIDAHPAWLIPLGEPIASAAMMTTLAVIARLETDMSMAGSTGFAWNLARTAAREVYQIDYDTLWDLMDIDERGHWQSQFVVGHTAPEMGVDEAIRKLEETGRSCPCCEGKTSEPGDVVDHLMGMTRFRIRLAEQELEEMGLT